jgi:hypothetical protein
MASHPASLPRPRAAAERPPWELIVSVAAVVCLALWPVGIHRAFGLPAHPLLIHVPVIFIPVLGLAALAAAIRPAWLERHWTPLAGFAVVTMAATLLTAAAGKAFEADRVKGLPAQLAQVMDARIHAHESAGEMLRRLIVGLTAALVLTMLARKLPSSALGRVVSGATAGIVLRVLVGVLAVASLFFVVRTGHLGAKLVWSQPAAGGQGFPGGGGFGPGGGGGGGRFRGGGGQGFPGGGAPGAPGANGNG